MKGRSDIVENDEWSVDTTDSVVADSRMYAGHSVVADFVRHGGGGLRGTCIVMGSWWVAR